MIKLMQTKYNLETMNIKPIKTEKDYDKALARLDVIFDAKPNSKEGDEAEILTNNKRHKFDHL